MPIPVRVPTPGSKRLFSAMRATLQEQADEIQARPGARTSTGMFNPRVVSLEEARTIAQARAEAEQAAGPQPQPKVVSPFQALGNLGGRAVMTGLEAVAETGLAGAQTLTAGELPIPGLPPSLRLPITVGGKEKSLTRSKESLREIGQAIRGERGFTETVGGLAARQRERPFVEQLGAGAVFDPLNLLPGVGFGPEIVRGTRAVVGAARRGAESALVRAPGTVLPEAGLRLAGAQPVAGGAEELVRVTAAASDIRPYRGEKPGAFWVYRDPAREFEKGYRGEWRIIVDVSEPVKELGSVSSPRYTLTLRKPSASELAAEGQRVGEARAALKNRAETERSWNRLADSEVLPASSIAPVPKRAAPARQRAVPSRQAVAKEPWAMTKREWLAADEGLAPSGIGMEVAQTGPRGVAQARKSVRQLEQRQALRYGVSDKASAQMTAASEGRVTLTPEEAQAIIQRVETPVTHRDVVVKAISEGKPVPPEVLADYPDLAAPGGVVRKEAAEDIAAAPSPAPVAAKVPVRRTRTTKPAPSRVEARAAPVEATGETQAIDSIAKGTPAELSIVDDVADFAKAADPSGGTKPPRRPPTRGGGGEQPPEPDDIFRQVALQATKGEKVEQTLLRRHEAAITTAENEARIAVDEGSQRLRALGIGEIRQGRVVPREADIPVLDDLFEALHNPSKVASGEMRVPAGLENEYNRLRQLTDWEESMRIDFDPEMAKVEDYFYRGWIVPKEGGARPPTGVARGRLGTTPAFKKPRVDATYREMRDAGFEPLSWNPYEQWRISRLQGVRYRQQMQLIGHLKKLDMAVTDASGVATEGWRTPKVGPAFEGKIFATTDAAGEPVAMYSRRFVVPDELAGRLESMYGVTPDLSNVHVGNRSISLIKAIDAVVFIPKRVKLFGSAFQQIDFLTRSYIGGWSGMVDSLLAGKPIEAVKNLAVIPRTTARVLEANFRPGARLAIRKQLDSTTPIIAGRPGIHLRGIMEAGLSTIDTTLLPSNLDRTARVIAEEAGLLGNKAVLRALRSIESSMRRGLFEGTYPAAQVETIRNSIAPRIVRLYGKNLSDEALNGMIAQATNKMFSTIPASQTVIQNRPLREILRRVFFSIGESEGLLRQAFGAIPIQLKGTKPFIGLKRQESLFWAEHWIGAYLGLIALANAIHFASTGEPLPADRWLPVSKDKWGPLPVGYNAKFAAPNIPFKGSDAQQLTMDIVGQMDTAFRLLDPISFLSSRESVPIRAFVTQTTERDFFGRPIDRVGPGGIYSRTANLINDMFAPIGPGQAAVQIGLQRGGIPEGLVPGSEQRIGQAGQLIQATGLNIRAQSPIRGRTPIKPLRKQKKKLEPVRAR